MTTELPSHASVVVVGGGVMGCSTLYHLARAGVTDALLIERNALTSGTTWHSAAQVRALRSSHNLTRLIQHSIELYADLEAETGQATGWVNRGSLSIATTPDRLVHIRRQAALARTFGLAAETICAGEAAERWPLMRADDVLGAVWSPGDGRVNPSDLCAALARGARSRGARIVEGVALERVLAPAGRITGIETSSGPVRCDALVLCTGLWSREAGALAGVSVPVAACEHFYLLTRPVPGAETHLPTLSDHDGHLYIRDEVGGLLVGCFEPGARFIDPARLGPGFAFELLPEDWDHFEPMMVNALHRLPVLEHAEVRMLLNGPESFTPDGMFLLGETPEIRGLFLGCGMNSVGIATGGGAGMALAHTIVEGAPPFDLHEADPARFHPVEGALAALTARAPEVLGRHYEVAYPGRQPHTARRLRETPLDARHRGAGAHLGQAHGFERPLHFGCGAACTPCFGRPPWFDRVAAEVKAAHEHAALFDQSTFGKIAVRGADAATFLDRVCANDLHRHPGRVVYTAMLDERAGFVSDLTVLRLARDDYRLLVGTGRERRDMAWLRRQLRGERVTIVDETESLALLAVAGPDAATIVEALGATALTGLGYFQHVNETLAGVPVTAARLSYVGEDGFELACERAQAVALYDALAGAGAKPAGLDAQSTMRIEKRFLSMGHDLDADVTPVEAGLEFAVAWESDFIGREALLRRRAAGPRRVLVTLVLEDPDAWPIGSEPVMLGEAVVGRTTSAGFGHRVARPVALAYLDPAQVPDVEHAPLTVDVAGERFAARATLSAAFDPTGARTRRRIAPNRES